MSDRTQQQETTLITSLLKYVAILLRYRWMIVGITIASAVGVLSFALLSLFLPPERSPLPNYYFADAQMLLSRGSSQSVSASVLSALGVSIPGAGSGPDYGLIALEVLHSRSFIDAIVERNDLIDYYGISTELRAVSRDVVVSHMYVDFSDQTGILTIGYEDISPQFAAQVTDSIVNELLEWFADRGGSDNLLAIQTMEQKLQEVEQTISALEAEITSFQTRYGVLRVEEIAETQASLLSEFQAQLLEMDLQIRNLEEFSRIENDPELLALEAQRANVESLMRDIEAGYTGGAERFPPRSQLPALEAQQTRLQMDLEIQGRIYEALSEQYEVAKLTADTDPVFSVLQEVEVPDEKSRPSRARLSIVVTVGGFFFSIVLALLIHLVRGIVGDPDKRRILSEEVE
jgi:tyrosine-protein kinase Etk/Wzc